MISDPNSAILGRCPGLPDEAFDHDGLVTKRVARAAALAQLRPLPGQTLWDIGTGAGSVSIEWCRTDPTCRALTVDNKTERTARARGNVERLTQPGQVELFVGDASALIGDWIDAGERPDAVFVGGGGSHEVIERCWEALGDGGRFVLHGVTLETELLAAWAFGHFGGIMQRIGVETSQPLGSMTGWSPARTIVAWFAQK